MILKNIFLQINYLITHSQKRRGISLSCKGVEKSADLFFAICWEKPM